MLLNFNLYDEVEAPLMILANPNKEEITTISRDIYQGLEISWKFNSFSELSFEVYAEYHNPMSDQNEPLPYYNQIVKDRLIHIDNVGWFIIQSTDEEEDGTVPYKTITAYSFEYELSSRGVAFADGYWSFYDPIGYEADPAATKSLMHKFLEQNQTWSIGDIDSELWSKKRYFSDVKGEWYSFLMSDVEEAFGEVIFEFDTEAQTVSAYLASNYIKDTDISLSFDNLVKSIDIEEINDRIYTALAVYGAGYMSVSSVNPLGTDYIYNFDYYKNLEWMSQELIDAINIWEAKVESFLPTYGDILAELKTQNQSLQQLKTQLIDLQGQRSAKLLVQSNQLSIANRTPQDYAAYSQTVSEVNALTSQITVLEGQIASLQVVVDALLEDVLEINTDLKLVNNFTPALLDELSYYIKEGQYENSNFVQTDTMDYSEIQELSLELYNQGLEVANKVSQPNYTFSMDTVSFPFLKEYEPFREQLELGAVLNVRKQDETWLAPVVLEINYSFEDPTNFSMVFGTRFRLSTDEWVFADMNGKNAKAASTTVANSPIWSQPVKSGFYDTVTDYMNNALNLANQEVINSNNQEIVQGEFGIRIRRALTVDDDDYDPSETTYDPRQIWIYNRGMAFTQDNWANTQGFFGEVEMNGVKVSGLIAEAIVGRLVAGNTFEFTNEDGTFTFDNNGATLTNATMTLVAGNNKSQLILNPNNPNGVFQLQTRQTAASTWNNTMYVDNNGNLVLAGNIAATSGTIGGWNIDTSRLYSFSGNVGLASSTSYYDNALGGYVVFWAGGSSPATAPFRVTSTGKLYAQSGTFSGSVSASNITGDQAQWNAMSGNLNLAFIAGSISADRISGGSITAIDYLGFPNGYVRGYGIQAGGGTSVHGNNGLALSCGGHLSLSGNSVQLTTSQDALVAGQTGTTIGVAGGGPLNLNGSVIYLNSVPKTASVTTKSYGQRLLYCYETPEVLFGDYGSDVMIDGKCIINIDPIFLETVDQDKVYRVYLQSYNEDHLYIAEKHSTYFVVASSNKSSNIAFDWQIVFSRKDMSNLRLNVHYGWTSNSPKYGIGQIQPN